MKFSASAFNPPPADPLHKRDALPDVGATHATSSPPFTRRSTLVDLHAGRALRVFRGNTLLRRIKLEISRLFSGPSPHA
jgi:hypothetical protein